jgi:hypothetical protein
MPSSSVFWRKEVVFRVVAVVFRVVVVALLLVVFRSLLYSFLPSFLDAFLRRLPSLKLEPWEDDDNDPDLLAFRRRGKGREGRMGRDGKEVRDRGKGREGKEGREGGKGYRGKGRREGIEGPRGTRKRRKQGSDEGKENEGNEGRGKVGTGRDGKEVETEWEGKGREGMEPNETKRNGTKRPERNGGNGKTRGDGGERRVGVNTRG